MEIKTINQIWKSQALESGIDFEKISTIRSTADELTLLRNELMKRQLRTAPFVIFYFSYMAYIAINNYIINPADWTRLGSAFIMFFFIAIGFGQLYLLYRWRQAEIFADTRSYLLLSRRILLGHLKLSRNSPYIFLPMAVLVLAMLYVRVQLTLFIFILVVLVLVFAVTYFLQGGFIDRLSLRYRPILEGIDAALKNLNEPE